MSVEPVSAPKESAEVLKLKNEHDILRLKRMILQEKEKIRQITKIRKKALKKP